LVTLRGLNAIRETVYLRVARFFLGTKYQSEINISNFNERPKNGPGVHKIYQHLPIADPPKFTQIWIFGLKTNHLATLSFVGEGLLRINALSILLLSITKGFHFQL
jgi:hypothetical protein